MLAVALTLAVCIGVALLVNAERTEDRRAALIFKTASSFGFVALAVAVGGLHDDPSRVWIVAGLSFACVGDVALALPGPGAFAAGLVAFLLGHLAYVEACAALVPWPAWLTAVVAVPIVASGAAYAWLFPQLGALRVAVFSYVVTITVMVVGAWAVFSTLGAAYWTLFAGALLFYVSDLSVARDRFVAPGFVNRAWGLPLYYAAQILFAWTRTYGGAHSWNLR